MNTIICHPKENIPWVNTFRINEARKQKKNTVDVLSLGSSMSAVSFSPMELYAKYGISAYNAGIEQQPVACTYFFLQEILRTQQPQVILFEVNMLFREQDEAWYRKTIDNLDNWRIKLEALSTAESYQKDSYASYIFPILKYHTRIEEISKSDFIETANHDYGFLSMGFKPMNGHYKPNSPMLPLKEDPANTEIQEIGEYTLNYFDKIVDLCKKKNIYLILYKTPVNSDAEVDNWIIEKHNTVKKIALDNELPFIDFNMENVMTQCGLDFITDMHDWRHVNLNGAIKITQYLGSYLNTNYSLPDRRAKKQYEFLDLKLREYERQKFNERVYYVNDFLKYLNFIKHANNGYTIFFSIRDEAVKNLNGDLRKQLNTLGFTDDFDSSADFQHSFIGILQDGKVIYEAMSDGNSDIERDALTYHGVLPNGLKYYVSSAGYQVGNASSIVIDGVEYSVNKRGFNIVIYDNQNERVVDSICFDTWKDAGLTFSR